jgi:hypothetical protein
VEPGLGLLHVDFEGAAVGIEEDRDVGIGERAARRAPRLDVADELPGVAAGLLWLALQIQRHITPSQRRQRDLLRLQLQLRHTVGAGGNLHADAGQANPGQLERSCPHVHRRLRARARSQ